MGQKKSRVTPVRNPQQSQGENPSTTQPRGQSTPTNQPRGQSTPTNQPRGQSTPTNQPRGQSTPTNQPRGQSTPTNQPRGQNTPTNQPRGESTHTTQSRGQSTPITQARGESTHTTDSNTNATTRESSRHSSPNFSISDELARELCEENNISQEELEFLWQQFNKYSLNADNLIQCDTTEFSDPFTKNVFRRILRAEDKPNNIEFAAFVQYLSKWSNSNGLAKSQLLFQIIFNGDPISKILLTKLVYLVYPELTQTQKEEKANTIVKVMDSKNSGVVDQEDFIEYFSRQDARTAINVGIKLELANTSNQ